MARKESLKRRNAASVAKNLKEEEVEKLRLKEYLVKKPAKKRKRKTQKKLNVKLIK